MKEISVGTIPDPYLGEQWLTAREFARVMGCSERHARRMVDQHLFADFGIPVYTRLERHRKRMFIFAPPSLF